jgi:hypothetical protein
MSWFLLHAKTQLEKMQKPRTEGGDITKRRSKKMIEEPDKLLCPKAGTARHHPPNHKAVLNQIDITKPSKI